MSLSNVPPRDLDEADAVCNSALWAAYGDALGFLSELATEKDLRRRTGKTVVEGPVRSTRRLGGRFGVTLELPAGCYSDDTQLRLSTSRAIRGDGEFDFEAFSKVELPVWLTYALGAGRATRAAASALSARQVTWASNFFDHPRGRYVDAGGNGAAMRVQPHVWAARNLSNPEDWGTDVLRNAICTHGHPRGIAGAFMHALLLAECLRIASVPDPGEIRRLVHQIDLIPLILREDELLTAVWIGRWEKEFGSSLEDAFKQVREECDADLDRVEEELRSSVNAAHTYLNSVEKISGHEPSLRGSGTKTSLAAAWLSWLFRDTPLEGLLAAANALGTDTDTIATMAGALLGAVAGKPPEDNLLDYDYILWEARRLARIRTGQQPPTFSYPDLLHWDPPRVQLDVVGLFGDTMVLAGLGRVKKINSEPLPGGQEGTCWQWLHLHMNQTVLAKRRPKLPAIPEELLPVSLGAQSTEMTIRPPHSQASLFDTGPARIQQPIHFAVGYRMTVPEAVRQAIEAAFDPSVIGRLFLNLVDEYSDSERAEAFARAVARLRKQSL
jgi:ADP-ribosylglycohydrolase